MEGREPGHDYFHCAAVRDKLEAAGLKFVADDRTTPEYLAKFVESEIAKWAVPIKASGVSVD
jgi:hypothetical protein